MNQCCFCVNLDAPPGDPCYPKGYVPPLLCNPVRSCCCGSRVRIVGRVHVSQRLDRFDINTNWQNYWETNEWDLAVVTLWHIERDGAGCKTVYDGIESLTATRHREYQFGAGEVHKEDTEPGLGFEPGQELRPEIACRPEPYNVWFRMLTFGDGVLPGAEDPILAPFIATCSDTVVRTEHFDPGDNDGVERDLVWTYSWSGDAECKKASILVKGDASDRKVFHPAYDDPYLTFEEKRTGTRTASIETIPVENDCCPKNPGDPYSPVDPIPVDPSGTPYNPVPGNPTTPGNRGFVLVPWAGLRWRGTPIFVRWWTGQVRDPGCGCWHPAKSLWERITGRST